MTSVKVKFRPSTNEGQSGRIVYLVSRNHDIHKIITDIRVFPTEWNEREAKLRAASAERVPNIHTYSQQIRLDLERLQKVVAYYDGQYADYTPDDVANEFRRLKQEQSLFGYMERNIARLRQLGHTGTANNYHAALNSIARFRHDEDLSLEAVDHYLMENYEAYLQGEGLTPNSISFYMRILRAVYNRAVNEELTRDNRPFRFVFTGIEKTRKRSIPFKDLKLIRQLELWRTPSLEFARDVFIFLFFCRGMSFIDAAFLKKSDVHDGFISYRRHKTGRLLQIKMEDQIREIVNRHSSDNSPYLLPIIRKPGHNERRQYESALRLTNNALKKIGKIIGLATPLTTYVSRHTWATIAKHKNVPINVISDALGHDSISTTQVYLASIDTSVIDRINHLVIKDL